MEIFSTQKAKEVPLGVDVASDEKIDDDSLDHPPSSR
uniref:Uncharacterized protein n=1 Tax=Arundo donax TaxID=35708 RepID=A0A0A9EHA9_ARUDO